MNKIKNKALDYFLGINQSFGLVMVLWLLLRCFWRDLPPINGKNVFFVFLSVLVPWFTNFIFNYSSPLYMRGMLHGVVWFVVEIILFNLLYGIAPEAQALLAAGGAFVVLYTVGLCFFSRMANRLNIPVRCVAAFNGKLHEKLTQ